MFYLAVRAQNNRAKRDRPPRRVQKQSDLRFHHRDNHLSPAIILHLLLWYKSSRHRQYRQDRKVLLGCLWDDKRLSRNYDNHIWLQKTPLLLALDRIPEQIPVRRTSLPCSSGRTWSEFWWLTKWWLKRLSLRCITKDFRMLPQKSFQPSCCRWGIAVGKSRNGTCTDHRFERAIYIRARIDILRICRSPWFSFYSQYRLPRQLVDCPNRMHISLCVR